MNFELEPLPEDADAILGEYHCELQTVVSDFDTQAGALQSDQTRSVVKRARDLDSMRSDVLAELDRINRTLTVDRQNLIRRKRELRRPQPATGDTVVRYQEVRATLRTVTSAKRKILLQVALESSDDLLLWAVCEAPGYLTGMDAEEHASYVEQAHDALHGDETRELEQAEALVNELLQQIETARTHVEAFEIEGYAHAV